MLTDKQYKIISDRLYFVAIGLFFGGLLGDSWILIFGFAILCVIVSIVLLMFPLLERKGTDV